MLINRRCTPIHADGGWSRLQANAAVGRRRVSDWRQSSCKYVCLEWTAPDQRKVAKLVTADPRFAAGGLRACPHGPDGPPNVMKTRDGELKFAAAS
jgi:hypothetical protein